jgi:hypothetical protein
MCSSKAQKTSLNLAQGDEGGIYLQELLKTGKEVDFCHLTLHVQVYR